MTADLIDRHRKVAAALAEHPHDPTKAMGGRCACVPCRARVLAEHGWPAATMGDETGIRSRNVSSITERLALTDNPFDGIDSRLAVYLKRMKADALAVQAIVATVALVDPDDIKTLDRLPPGSGECECGCGHHCNPRKKPEDRLRSGFAPACYRRWLRWRETYAEYQPSRSDFIHACRRERQEAS